MTEDRDAQRRAAIREQFGALYDEARWPDEALSSAATKERDGLARDLLGAGVTETANGTKLQRGPLSRGCQACVDGTWSCLYIAEWCQADCFYCPKDSVSRRSRDDYTPNAERMGFSDPQFYADYVEACGVKEVGISGGEPLAALDRVLSTVSALKERTNGRLYVHVYTNGLLATPERLASLRDAGVDELRLDITARDYDTSALALARDYIDTLTVEIPAIPEDEARLPAVFRELSAIGVDHLNLHQLDVTVANAPAFLARGYTLVHQPVVVVMESELTALRAFRQALEDGIDLNINYCCPTFRYRFQRRKHTARAAALERGPCEDVTLPGFLRRLVLHDRVENLAQIEGRLRSRGHDSEHARIDGDAGTLTLDLAALRDTEAGGAELVATYFLAEMATGDLGDGWHESRALDHGQLWVRRSIAAEAQFTLPVVRDAYVGMLCDGWDQARAFAAALATGGASVGELRPLMREWSQVLQLRGGEVIEKGLGSII